MGGEPVSSTTLWPLLPFPPQAPVLTSLMMDVMWESKPNKPFLPLVGFDQCFCH